MLFDKDNLAKIIEELKPFNATLVAVSKTQPAEAIADVYKHGHAIFGENYVQELIEKSNQLPKDIKWHFIGHLQSNKVRQIAPFVSLIQSVDSLKLLEEIDKQAEKANHTIDCLLEVHIASEETKFGLNIQEAEAMITQILSQKDKSSTSQQLLLNNIRIRGLMGMASFTDDENLIRSEFRSLRKFFEQIHPFLPGFNILSMGMTSDYQIALEEGSTMVRIGTAIFGERKARY